ncbi:MAG: carboxypeptidase regulatory-like domain-containing protein [Candidatus Kapabacteria bacterium]|jgi:uncharacterized protein YjbI with pentapeptide repeats|nr:carboxypeptidase regulatory-like domain-containing protein [Candidatus Kapabacteria bacterium]
MRSICTFFVVLLLFTVAPALLSAFPGGFVGVTVVGCNCHGPANSATTISIPGRTSPITARTGETLSLSLMVAHASQSAAGMNIAVVNSAGTNAGTLIAGEGSQLLGAELTHSTPRGMSGGSATFPFQWTAPTTPGTYTLRAVGNAVNRDGGSGGDAWNALPAFTITVEAPVATFTVSGRILNASGVAVSDVIVTDGTRSATTDAQGNYTLSGVPNGTYTLVAARTNWTFAPTTLAVTVNGANVTGQNFTGTRLWAVRGTILNPSGVAVSDVIVAAGSSTATTDAQGNYTLWLANGSYTIRVARTNWTFSPETRAVTVNGADLAAQNFTGTRLWAVRGTILNPSGVAVSDAIVAAGTSTATTDAQGNYTLWLANGSYTIRVARTNWTFSPETRVVTVNGADLAAQNFTGTRLWAVRGTILNPSGVAVSGVSVSAASGTTISSSATTDAQGNYTLWLANGTYILTPSRMSWTFTPASLSVTVAGADFQAAQITGNLMSSVALTSMLQAPTVSPNPSTGITTISYTTSSHGRIRYEVYSSLGELVRSFSEERPAGMQRYALLLEGLPQGAYYCRIASEQGIIGTAAILLQP